MTENHAPNSFWGKLTPSKQDQVFLEGPRGRIDNLLRAIRIFFEFLKGFRSLHFVGPCITVFGSARFIETHPYYAQAQETGKLLALKGFTVLTGGGPGIMEAANRGAKDAGGYSVGCNIKLPKEQKPNPYLDRWVEFDHFFVRKVMLVKYSYGFVAMPGGFGTLDEIFETLTLIQTGKIRDFPVVLIGIEYWKPLIEFIKNTLLKEHTILEIDLDYLMLTDSPEEAVDYIYKVTTDKFGLTWNETKKKKWYLFES